MGGQPPAHVARALRALSVVVATACFGLPASAHAATVESAGGTLTVTAAAGESNQVAVTVSSGNFVVRDPSATLSAVLGCSGAVPGQVSCSTSGVTRIEIDAGDGDDTVTVTSSTGARITGGPGADRLTGGNGGDTFVEAAASGADVMIGGAGRDTADYSARTEMVALSNDGEPGDGAPGEGDDIRADVERLLGGAGDDVLTGGPGADELRGNNGADTFRASPGADVYAGGNGFDVADYSDRTDALSVDLDGVADDGSVGEADNVQGDVDEVLGGAAADALTGHNSTNTLRGGAGDDVLSGRDGKDTLVGGDGSDRLDGGRNDDIFDGGAGADTFIGGAGGSDSLDYSGRTGRVTITANGQADDGEAGEGDNVDAEIERLTGGPADDTIAAGSGVSSLVGGAGNDTVTGGPLADTLDGGDGDDRLDGGIGGDKLSGGAGTDSADYSARTAGVAVDADDNRDDGEPGENDNVARDIERIVGGAGGDDLQGEEGNDVLEGGEGDDRLDGQAGADSMHGGGGVDRVDYSDRHEPIFVEVDAEADDGALREGDFVAPDVEVAVGGAGQDRLVGDAGPNQLSGGGGDDVVIGGPGDDRLEGDEGDDQLDGGDGVDDIDGGDGVDLADYVSLPTAVQIDLLTQPAAGDRLIAVENVNGTNAADSLKGGDGDNELRGQGGDDKLDGGAGADALVGDNGRDTADYSARTEPVTIDNDGYADDGHPGEGDQVDVTVENLTGGAGNDSLIAATAGRNALRGGAGDDTLGAGSGDDRLYGHEGNDTLEGGNGADRLDGAEGEDRLEGGKGKDRIDAGPGRDDIDVKDGARDNVICGPGRDTYRADPADKLVGCEVKWTPDPPPAQTPGPPVRPEPEPTPTFPPVRVEGARVARRPGKFVPIPGFPGERIDSRLLRDIRWMRARYKIWISDGYALHGHTKYGEHPIGLAADIVPGPGGSWRDIDRLAKWAEPKQNHPRAPFRWVGYDGDANHGRGNHLHLSWNHAPTKRGRPASWIYVIDFAAEEKKRPGPSRLARALEDR